MAELNSQKSQTQKLPRPDKTEKRLLKVDVAPIIVCPALRDNIITNICENMLTIQQPPK